MCELSIMDGKYTLTVGKLLANSEARGLFSPDSVTPTLGIKQKVSSLHDEWVREVA